jgi:hypothetical protein
MPRKLINKEKAMKAQLMPSRGMGSGDLLSGYEILNDLPRAMIQLKRPAEEVKLLIGAMKGIARYLDGLEDGKALRSAQLDVESVWFGI